MKWLTEEDEYSSMLEEAINEDERQNSLDFIIQRYSTAVLYFATTPLLPFGEEVKVDDGGGSAGDSGWIKSDNWLSSKHVCDWSFIDASGRKRGITECNANLEITKMDFSSNNLNGTLPEEFYLFDKLRYAQFYGNDLSGAISSSVSKLTSLQNLLLARNAFTSTLPDELYSLFKLQKLVLFDNSFSGTLSSLAGSMPNLSELRLQQNEFLGAFPQEICNIDKLTVLEGDCDMCQSMSEDCCTTCFSDTST